MVMRADEGWSDVSTSLHCEVFDMRKNTRAASIVCNNPSNKNN
jgi:hypothetical protein